MLVADIQVVGYRVHGLRDDSTGINDFEQAGLAIWLAINTR